MTSNDDDDSTMTPADQHSPKGATYANESASMRKIQLDIGTDLLFAILGVAAVIYLAIQHIATPC